MAFLNLFRKFSKPKKNPHNSGVSNLQGVVGRSRISLELQNQLKLLSEELPHGSIKVIAEELDVSRQHVHNVFNGKGQSVDQEVVDKAIEVLNRRKSQEKVMASRISEKLQ